MVVGVIDVNYNLDDILHSQINRKKFSTPPALERYPPMRIIPGYRINLAECLIKLSII